MFEIPSALQSMPVARPRLNSGRACLCGPTAPPPPADPWLGEHLGISGNVLIVPAALLCYLHPSAPCCCCLRRAGCS